MSRLGVALTVYNAFEDLGIAIDLIRDNWALARDSIVVVSCGYERLERELGHLRIDAVTRYETPRVPRLQRDGPADATLSIRIFEGIRQGCLRALDTGVEYVVHAHADAWMFSAESILSVVGEMERRGAVFAARINYRPRSKTPVVDDHFFVFQTEFARRSGLWEVAYDAPLFNPVFFEVGGIHAMMFLLIEGRVPYDKFFAYSEMSRNTGMFGEAVGSVLNPWNFELRRQLLHSNVRYGDDVLFLRQRYLRRFSRLRGNTIGQYMQKQFRPSFVVREGKVYPYYFNPLNLSKAYQVLQTECLRPAARKLRETLASRGRVEE